MFEFTQIGWFEPGSKRFCYTDEKKTWPDSHSDYTHPVFAIDSQTASRLMVHLQEPELPELKEALEEFQEFQKTVEQGATKMYEHLTRNKIGNNKGSG
jgi:hypothetical protein